MGTTLNTTGNLGDFPTTEQRASYLRTGTSVVAVRNSIRFNNLAQGSRQTQNRKEKLKARSVKRTLGSTYLPSEPAPLGSTRATPEGAPAIPKGTHDQD